MALIPLNCPLCSGVFQAESAHAGSEVRCPHCQEAVLVPEALATSGGGAPAARVSASSTQPDQSFASPPPMPDAPPTPVEPPEAAPPSPAARAPSIPEMPMPDAPPVPTSAPPVAGVSEPAGESELPRLTCAACEHMFRVELDTAGGQVYCPGCNAIVDVPDVLVEAPDVPEAEEIVAPEFQFEDPEETADDIIERGGIRHLSREERSQARARRSAFMLVTGFLLLFGAILFLQHFEEFFMGIWERYGPAPVEEGQGL